MFKGNKLALNLRNGHTREIPWSIWSKPRLMHGSWKLIESPDQVQEVKKNMPIPPEPLKAESNDLLDQVLGNQKDNIMEVKPGKQTKK